MTDSPAIANARPLHVLIIVDVPQRIDDHPQNRVHELTPRLWKEHFAQNPLRCYVDRTRSP